METAAQWGASSPDIIRQIKSRKMRWAEHVARTGAWRNVYRVCWESPKERDNSKERGVNWRMGLEWIFGRPDKVCGVDSPGSG
jgi:hypothetical protein